MPPNIGLPDFELSGAVQSLIAVVLFFTPGFIAGKAFGLFFQRRDDSEKVKLLEYIALSCVNYAVWSWLLLLVWRNNLWETHPYWALFGFLLVLLVSPIVCGCLLAFSVEHGLAARITSRLGMKPPQPVGTAWEWFFRRHRNRRWWVIVRLKNGIMVYGFFGWHSYMGDDRQHGDLYLEAECSLGDNGKLRLLPDTGGVYLKFADIEGVSFKWVDEPQNTEIGANKNDIANKSEPAK